MKRTLWNLCQTLTKLQILIIDDLLHELQAEQWKIKVRWKSKDQAEWNEMGTKEIEKWVFENKKENEWTSELVLF